MRPDVPIKVIGKVGQVLDAFLKGGAELHLQEIAEASELDLSTTSRIVNSLVGIGVLRFDQVQRIYTPGLLFLELSRTVLNRFSFRELTHREMLALSKVTGWQCNLAVLDEREPEFVVYIDATSTPREPIERSPIGQRRRASTTASGRVLLAYQHASGGEAGQAQGVVEHDWLEAVLHDTRSQGVAVVRADDGTGFWAIAAPLFGPDGTCVATLATGTDSVESFREHEEWVTGALRDTARGISSAMLLSGGNSARF